MIPVQNIPVNSPNAGTTVIGIDPGSRFMGWGIVRESSGVLKLVDCGVLRPKSEDFSERLGQLFTELHALIGSYAPKEAAIENIFTHKNILSALKLGQARGIAVGACAAHNIPVSDYEPTLIKKTLTGNGRAEKSQLSFMVGQLLGVKPSWAVDAGDALGCAICHLTMRRYKKLTG